MTGSSAGIVAVSAGASISTSCGIISTVGWATGTGTTGVTGVEDGQFAIPGNP